MNMRRALTKLSLYFIKGSLLFCLHDSHQCLIPFLKLILPPEWSVAYIRPMFNKGCSSYPSNYRSISLTKSLCKVMERLIVSDLLTYLLQNNLITHHQHGFLTKHFTCTQLLETLNDCTFFLKSMLGVDSVYLDFANAFDTVSHVKFPTKLTGYGIRGHLLCWITAFHSSCSQSVKIDHFLSSPSYLKSGVPQGSVLGPILFLIFNQWYYWYFSGPVSIKLYADDAKLYSSIRCPDDRSLIQSGVNSVTEWSSTWLLSLAVNKCSMLHVGTHATSQYRLGVSSLPISKTIGDLGVEIDNLLSFETHIHNMGSTANRRIYLIRRCFLSKDVSCITKAYVVFVRPLFASLCPSYKYLVDSVESVQRRFTK